MLLPPVPLFVRARPADVLALPARRRVYEEVRAHPGISLCELKRILNLENGVLAYHLATLQRTGYVHSAWVGRQRQVYPSGVQPLSGIPTLTPRDAQVLELIATLSHPCPTNIAAALCLSRSRASHLVHSLEGQGLVRVEHAGRTTFCFLRRDGDACGSEPISF